MRQLNNIRNPIVTNSSDTSNTLSTNKQLASSFDTDKILNKKNDISNINNIYRFSPINLLKNQKNRLSCGLNNKLLKVRAFFALLLNKDSNLSESNSSSSSGSSNESKILTSKLNESSLKNHPKYYSIALNLIQCDQGIYENTYCTCGSKEEKVCINCLSQNGKFQNDKDGFRHSKQLLLPSLAAPPPMIQQNYSMIHHKSLDYDSTIPLDILNSTSLIPSSISLVQNPNYVLYDIPEVDESDESPNETDLVEYYYNHTEKI
jgi:hypothetical protein